MVFRTFTETYRSLPSFLLRKLSVKNFCGLKVETWIYTCVNWSNLFTQKARVSLCVYAGRASSLYVNWMKKKQSFSLGSVLFPTRKTSYLKRWLTQFYSIAYRTELPEAVSECIDCESLGFHSGVVEASVFQDMTRLYTQGYWGLRNRLFM